MKNNVERRAIQSATAAAVGLLLLVACTLLAGYASGLYMARRLYLAETASALLRLLVVCVSLVPSAVYLRRKAGGPAQGSTAAALPLRLLVPLFLGIVLAVNAAVSVVRLLLSVQAGAARALPTGTLALMLYFFTTCVVTAVLEEAIFRGGILPLLQGFGSNAALAATTLLFTLMHATLWELPVVAVLGAVLGLAWQYGASLRMCMALHFANNTLAFVLALVQARLDAPVASVMVLLILGAAVLAFGVAALALWKRRETLRRRDTRKYTQSLWHQPALWAMVLVAAAFFASRIL